VTTFYLVFLPSAGGFAKSSLKFLQRQNQIEIVTRAAGWGFVAVKVYPSTRQVFHKTQQPQRGNLAGGDTVGFGQLLDALAQFYRNVVGGVKRTPGADFLPFFFLLFALLG